MDLIRSDNEIQRVAKNLLFGSVPERRKELEEIWHDCDLRFHIVGDTHKGSRIIFDAGLFRDVRFNHRVVRAFWIAGFAAWEGYRAISEATDPAQCDLMRFGELLDHFDEMISADAADECPMPFGIPEPGTFVEKQDNAPYRAAAELATIALGWAFLHEVRHIRHQREFTSAPSDGSDPSLSRGEEISCDEYATDFIIEKVDDYAKDAGVAPDSVRLKRELAIYFACFAITLLAKDNWQQSDSHPAVQDRINAIVARLGQQRDERALVIAHLAFTALNQKWHGAPSVVLSK
jgi:hypothetical protein